MAFLRFAAVAVLLFAAQATAQTTTTVAPEAAAEQPAPSPLLSRIPVGTPISLETVDIISSRTTHRGDTFSLRLVAPIVSGGETLVPAGAIATGEVVEARPSGSGGQPGMLVLAGRYLEVDGAHLSIRWPVMMLAGHDTIDQSNMASTFVSPLAAFVPGSDVNVPPGTRVAATSAGESAEGGTGRIVFFRPRRNSAAVYRYGMREGETEIARLRNGSYFTYEAPSGIHEFNITGPFLLGAPRQTLRLEVQPGETYYVEHAIGFLVVSNEQIFQAYTLDRIEAAGAPRQ